MTRPEAWWRLGMGAAQIVAATVTLIAWMSHAPGALIVLLVLVSVGLVVVSRILWRGR